MTQIKNVNNLKSTVTYFKRPVLSDIVWAICFTKGDESWHDYLVADTKEEAKSKIEKFLSEYEKEKGFVFAEQAKPIRGFKPKFSGGFFITEADQYVTACLGHGINLHLFRKGWYDTCSACYLRKTCQEESLTSGEQSVASEL